MSRAPLNALTSGGTGSEIKALLGPTNTGKTHRAIERMIEHGGGMIGLPLRLLAREVYDRVCARVGPQEVALITGEERIEPRDARYWVCTVESMPVFKAVPFVAVDEIQLATHPERGHVFTDRLLGARGTRETWFLGSDTMRPVLERLTPTAKFETLERFSKLSYTRPKSLRALPERSAVVAFSVSHVYELADRIRATRGGAAVVLGALSPRARNAQVSLFESGAVSFLVSTDAIGMGLNLDIRHVFFGATQKYDGREVRRLLPWELGQIAGRAGRYRRDGFFGLTKTAADRGRLPGGVIEAIEAQRFAPVYRVFWRNSDLDLSSVDALWAGLMKAPRSRALIHARGMRDERALEGLLRIEDVAVSARRHPELTALLWDVCRIPDFRQGSEAAHVRLLAEVFRHLSGPHGQIDRDWIDRQIVHLSQGGGGIDAMMRRIAHARTWAYIAHRGDWVSDPDHWRGRVLRLEEGLSDALHESLTQHFVEERVHVRVDKPVPKDVALDGGQVVTQTLALGRMVSFSFVPDPEASRIFGPKVVRRAARQVCAHIADARAAALVDGSEDTFEWGPALSICHRGEPMARLWRGPRLDAPVVRCGAMDLLGEERRRQIQEAAAGWVRVQIQVVREMLPEPEESGPLRGLVYLLRSHLGTLPRGEAAAQIEGLKGEDRHKLAKMGVRTGRQRVYALPLLKPALQAARAACWAAHLDIAPPSDLPGSAVAPALSWSPALAEGMGWPRVGPRCVRADMIERIDALLRKLTRKGAAPLPTDPAAWLGCGVEDWRAVAEALGYRVRGDNVLRPKRRR